MDRNALIAFMVDELGADPTEFDDETLLFSTGLLDSFGLVDLMAFLEARNGFKINPFDIAMEDLDSVALILGYCERRRAE